MSERLGRGHGWVPDEAVIRASDATFRPLSRMVGSAVRRPPSLTYVRGGVTGIGLLDKILDQGQTNSCVGCSISTALFLRGVVQFKHRPRRASAKGLYDVGRLPSGGQLLEGIDMLDQGCNPRSAIDGAVLQGIASEEDWPLFTTDPELLALGKRDGKPDVSWINVPPTFDLFSAMFDFSIDRYARADDGEADAIIAQLESALVAGEFPIFGMFTPSDYQDVRGTEIYDHPTTGSTSGYPGHMQAIGGYDEDSFHIPSSWGVEHGDGGIVRVSKRWIASKFVFDRLVLTNAPNF